MGWPGNLIDAGATTGAAAIGDSRGDASDEDFGLGGEIAGDGGDVVGAEGGSESDAVEDFELSSGGGSVESVKRDGRREVVLNAAGSLAGAGGREDSECRGDDVDGDGIAAEVVIGDAEAHLAEWGVRGHDGVDLAGAQEDGDRGDCRGPLGDGDGDAGKRGREREG